MSFGLHTKKRFLALRSHSRNRPSNLYLIPLITDIQAQAFRVQIQLIPTTCFLQNLCNSTSILYTSQVDITSTLLDSITNKLSRFCLTICSNNSSLFLLTSFVYNESRSLSFLLCDLFSLNSSCKLGGEVKMLNTEISSGN